MQLSLYEFLELVSEDAFGKIWQARHKFSRAAYTIKVVPFVRVKVMLG